MTQQMPGSDMHGSLLTKVREDMKIVDVDDNQVGRVDGVFLGSVGVGGMAEGLAAADPEIPGTGGPQPVIEFLADVLNPEELPEVVRNRMEREGFIYIEGGLLGSNRYILPDQISRVSGDTVYLNVGLHELDKK